MRKSGSAFGDVHAVHGELLGVEDAVHFPQHAIDIAARHFVAGGKRFSENAASIRPSTPEQSE